MKQRESSILRCQLDHQKMSHQKEKKKRNKKMKLVEATQHPAPLELETPQVFEDSFFMPNDETDFSDGQTLAAVLSLENMLKSQN